MGFTKSSQTMTVWTLTADNQGGFWFVSRNANNQAHTLGWTDSGTVQSVPELYGFDTFRDLMAGMIQHNVALPAADVSINIEDKAEQANLYSQFEAPALSDNDCQILDNNFNSVELLVKFGIFPLVRRFYLLGLITLAELADVLIGLGKQDKITKVKVNNVINWLLTNNHISPAQANNFNQRWTNEVGD